MLTVWRQSWDPTCPRPRTPGTLASSQSSLICSVAHGELRGAHVGQLLESSPQMPCSGVPSPISPFSEIVLNALGRSCQDLSLGGGRDGPLTGSPIHVGFSELKLSPLPGASALASLQPAAPLGPWSPRRATSASLGHSGKLQRTLWWVRRVLPRRCLGGHLAQRVRQLCPELKHGSIDPVPGLFTQQSSLVPPACATQWGER